MAAQPARWVGGLNRELPYGRCIEVQDVDDDRRPSGSSYWTSVDDLSNGETFKVCGALGLNPKDFTSLESRKDAIRDEVNNGSQWNPKNATPRDAATTTTATTTTWTANENESPPPPVTTIVKQADPELEKLLREEEEIERRTRVTDSPVKVNDPDNAAQDAAQDIATAIATAIAAATANAGVNEEAVRKIVAEETANLRPTVIEVNIPERSTVTIDRTEHEVFAQVVKLLGIREHVWLVGPAGTGKSTIAHHSADALELRFYSISCHAQMTASQVFGYMNATGEYVPSLFRQAYENGGVFLFDEIDAGSSNVLAAVNQALSNGHCAFPDRMVSRHDDFVCVGAANTFGKGVNAEYSGRAKIDEATIDRFVFVEVDYDRKLESALVKQYLPIEADAQKWILRLERYRTNAASHGLKVILGTRAVVGGAKLLAAGFTDREAIDLRVLRGLSDDVRRKIEQG